MQWWNRLLPGIFKSQIASVVGGVFKGRLSSSSAGSMSFQQAVASGYKNLVWVHRCVAELGKAVGSVPWRAYQIGEGNKLTRLVGHPLEQLIERPNPFYTRKELMEAWAVYLSLAGNSYFEVVFVQGKPKELYVLRPDWMTPIPDSVNYLAGYDLDNKQGHKAKYTPQEVLHFKYLDPLNEYVGMSPLTAAARTIATEDAAVRWNKSIFDNSAVPNGILKVPATGLKKQDRDKLKEELEKEFTQENLHRPMVLWGGMEWSKMAMDAKDLDFLKQRQLNKYEVCAILDTPPQIVGANEDPTYANYDVARTAYWEDNIISKLEWFQAKVNVALAPYYGPGIELRYDVSDVPAMRASFAAKVDTSKTLWMMGYPINAINRRVGLGFDDVPWGNAWWAQMNMMPVTSDEQPVITDQNPLQRVDPGQEGTGVDPFTGEPIQQE